MKKVDWTKEERRPFKRAFAPFTLLEEGSREAVTARRKELGILKVEEVAGEDVYPLESIDQLATFLPHWLLEALTSHLSQGGLTALQAQALPLALTGQNLALIGSEDAGEAMTYLVAAALQAQDQEPVSREEPGPTALVVAADEDLALGIYHQARDLQREAGKALSRLAAVATLASCGHIGNLANQKCNPSLVNILVGTAQRLCKLLRQGQLNLHRVTLLVLHGYDPCSEDEVHQLAADIRPERHTITVARTWPPTLAELSSDLSFAGGPAVHVTVGPREAQVDPALDSDPDAKEARIESLEAKIQELDGQLRAVTQQLASQVPPPPPASSSLRSFQPSAKGASKNAAAAVGTTRALGPASVAGAPKPKAEGKTKRDAAEAPLAPQAKRRVDSNALAKAKAKEELGDDLVDMEGDFEGS